MQVFINSNAFVGLTTILTGLIVIAVYFWQKRDLKIQAARVLLTEIRIAEDRIEEIKDKIKSGSVFDFPSVFPSQNWKKYAHIFISDFDQDELKMINAFYDYGELIEDFAKRNNNYFWIVTEERTKVTVNKIADFVVESLDYSNKNPDEYVKNKSDFLSKGLDLYNQLYAPMKTVDGISEYVAKMPKITTSSCGIKLKKIAKMN